LLLQRPESLFDSEGPLIYGPPALQMLPIGRTSPACTAQKRLKTNTAESWAGVG